MGQSQNGSRRPKLYLLQELALCVGRKSTADKITRITTTRWGRRVLPRRRPSTVFGSVFRRVCGQVVFRASDTPTSEDDPTGKATTPKQCRKRSGNWLKNLDPQAMIQRTHKPYKQSKDIKGKRKAARAAEAVPPAALRQRRQQQQWVSDGRPIILIWWKSQFKTGKNNPLLYRIYTTFQSVDSGGRSERNEKDTVVWVARLLYEVDSTIVKTRGERQHCQPTPHWHSQGNDFRVASVPEPHTC